jgi:16S rRNA (guanine966-N2)-methyltransferase
LKQEIQIIGGLYRGKKITFPDSEGLRPTPNRIRETLFNWLMRDINNARCLDAFAGSGALGFEAFSRGAAKVTFIEQTPIVQKYLEKTIKQFANPKLQLIKSDAHHYIKNTSDQFDIIFLDPPFSKNYLPQFLDELCQFDILAPEGLVYIEAAEISSINETQWQQLKLKRAGQVHYGLFKRTRIS